MPPLTITGYALFGITMIIAIVMVVAVIRIVKAIAGRGGSRKAESRGESAMLSMALQEAVTKLKTQERATAARAESLVVQRVTETSSPRRSIRTLCIRTATP